MATITDFLKQQGKPSDYKSRQALAAQYGIQGYVGSAPQNISLLQQLQQAGTAAIPVSSPAGVATTPVNPGSPTIENISPSGQPASAQLIGSQPVSTAPIAPDPAREYRLNLARNALRNVYGREATQQEIDALAYDPTLASQGQLETRLRFQQNPVAAVEQLYQQQHTNLGLPGIKESIQQATTKLGELDQKKLDEIANINNNPWISEGERNRRITQLDQKYEQKRGALANQLQLQQGLYDRGSQFAQNVVQQALRAQESDLTSSHQAIQQAMERAAKQAELQHQIAKDTIDQQRQLALASAGTEPINVGGYQILPKGAVDPTELLKARIAAQAIAARTSPNVTFNIPGLPGSFTGNRKSSGSSNPLVTGTDLANYAQTTIAGRDYIDSSTLQGKERNQLAQLAAKAGVPFISKEQAEGLQEIDNARYNQKSIIDQITPLLPTDASGRIAGGALKNKLSQVFQTEDQLAAFNSWRTAAINTLRATAGSKGLRINQAEIQAAIQNDIPRITDTVGTAEQKFNNINTLLENAEKSVLVRNRSQVGSSTTTPIRGKISGGLGYKITP